LRIDSQALFKFSFKGIHAKTSRERDYGCAKPALSQAREKQKKKTLRSLCVSAFLRALLLFGVPARRVA
jgi:hypothetical protein